MSNGYAWDNRNPRAFVNALSAKHLKGGKLTALEEKILRGQSAQANGFENIGIFGIAVVSNDHLTDPWAQRCWPSISLTLYRIPTPSRSSPATTLDFRQRR